MPVVGITGVNGMVGGALVSTFANSGIPVCSFSTNPSDASVIKLTNGTPQTQGQPITQIVHCGALSGGNSSEAEYDYANVHCTRQLLRWCEEQGVKHFIYISTGGVYGEQPTWVDESTPLNPVGFYAQSKAQAEDLVLAAKIPIVTIIRLYFPIGPLDKPHFFATLSNKIRSGSIFLNTELGLPHISPIDLLDVAHILQIVVGKELGGVYNLSANQQTNIKEVAMELAQAFEVELNLEISPTKVGNYLGRANKIIEATGFGNFKPITQALREKVLHYLK